ncbi:MAG: type IV secretion system DNA-binding domain-containing protein [Patescibacteria group bacterium]
MQEDPEQITYFASTNARGKALPFGIKRRDRARHMYVIGKTGMGKSTLLENMAIQDIRNGEGMAFIDPHGSTADRIMEYVPAHRVKDVVYFAPFDMDYPVAFNVMEDVGYDKRHLVVSGLLSAFRKIWVDAWSARMEYILSNTLLALLEYPGATLLDVNRMLINKAFRKKVVENVKDPVVKAFWVEEFATYTDRYTQEATPAIQNKIGQFTSNPLIRNIVGQPKSSFDIRQLMDDKKILIINLSKGRVGEVNATLLGSMLVTKIYLAAMSRADVPVNVLQALPNFYFYVDEFQSFANQSFADILSEARKYKLNLIIAHQYVEQMEEEVRDAVFGNVGTTVVFRVGPFDAEVLETIFAPQFEAVDLVNLGFAQIYLTLMINGVGSPPFSAVTLPPFDPPPERFVEAVLANSRAVYGAPRTKVEQDIKDWTEPDVPVAPEPKPKKDYRPAYSSSSSAPRPAPAPTSTPEQPYVRQEAPRHPTPHTTTHPDPRALGETLARKHSMATSSALEPRGQPRPAPRPAKPAAPPLEGATSLRDALLQATGAKKPPTAAIEPVVHPPVLKPKPTSLKDALRKIAPAPVTPPAQPDLSSQELQDMLKVDGE